MTLGHPGDRGEAMAHRCRRRGSVRRAGLSWSRNPVLEKVVKAVGSEENRLEGGAQDSAGWPCRHERSCNGDQWAGDAGRGADKREPGSLEAGER